MTKSLEEFLEDGTKQAFSLKYIDWNDPENNDFHFTEKFVVEEHAQLTKEKTRRPDIVLFVNGIPCKKFWEYMMFICLIGSGEKISWNQVLRIVSNK